MAARAHGLLVVLLTVAALLTAPSVGAPQNEPWPVVASMPVGSSPVGMAVLPTGAKGYVANQGSGTVTVMDLARLATVRHIPVGSGPHDPVLSPDAARLYVPCLFSSAIYVIDTAADEVVQTVMTGGFPAAVAFSSDGSRVTAFCLSAGGSSAVSVIDVSTGAVVASIPVPTASLVSGFALSPDGRRAYVTSASSSTTEDVVSVLDLVSNSVVAQTVVGDDPIALALTEDGTRVVVANYTSGSVAFLDGASGALLGNFAGMVQPFRVRTAGGLAYILNGGDVIEVFDAAAPSWVRTVTAPGLYPTVPVRGDLARRASDGLGLATGGETGQVHAFQLDPARAGYGMRLWSILVGDGPSDVVFAPDGARAFVVQPGFSSVAVVGSAPPAPEPVPLPPPPPPPPTTIASAMEAAVSFVRSRMDDAGLAARQARELQQALRRLEGIGSPYDAGGLPSPALMEPVLAKMASAIKDFQQLEASGMDTAGMQALLAEGASHDTETLIRSREEALGADHADVVEAWSLFRQGEQARTAGDFRSAVRLYKDAVHVFKVAH